MPTCRLITMLFGLLGLLLTAQDAWAIEFGIGQSKEELGLKYELSVVDHGTGRVTIELEIADAGKLKPINSISLYIPEEGTSGRPDLMVSLATRTVDGKTQVRAHMKKELAERAQLQLKTTSDPRTGKPTPLTGYYFTIHVDEFIKDKK
ncbi:hypothetical protein [Gimesia sp.]|uniref:hypothetical protein n=1 Tax=Gimesia sp. TaxID=2024833 RepID=UPI0025C737DA|nr:hypothetical protein [Gimesia sp.]